MTRPANYKNMNETLKTITQLSDDAKVIFGELLEWGITEINLKSDYDQRSGWSELVESDFVNCWTDDSGVEFCEIGEQA